MNGRRFSGVWEVIELGTFVRIRERKLSPVEVCGDTLCVELEHIGQGNGRLASHGTAARTTSIKHYFEPCDILFGRLRPYLRKWWYADRIGICSTEIWPLVVDWRKAESGFVYLLVQTDQFLDAAGISYGTHMPRADWNFVSCIEFCLPPLSEQRAIAAVLSDVDDLVGALEALIDKKRDIMQAAMQQLLTGRTRLSGFRGEWKKVVVGKIAHTYGGLTGKRKSDFGDGNASYISFLDVLENVVLTRERFDRVHVSPSESQNCVRMGDVLFNATSETPEDLAMGTVVAVDTSELYLNSFCFGLRILDRERCDPLFLAYFSRGEPGRNAMYALSQGATRYNLSKRYFLELELPLPPLPEQRAIVGVLSDMDTEIATLERRLEKTRAIKQGMMQQLLTGSIRLPISDDHMEDDDVHHA